MKKDQALPNSNLISESELSEYKGGFIIPYLISRLAMEAGILLGKAIDWLKTEH